MYPEYRIRGYAGPKHDAPLGAMVIETTNRGRASKDMEVAVFKSRIERGDILYCEVLLGGHVVEEYGYRNK